MSAHLKNVASAADGHDRASATRAIDAFAADVAQQKAAGRLSTADYVALETGISRTRSRIALDILSPAPTSTPAAAPVAPVTQTVVQGNVGSPPGLGYGRLKSKVKGDGGAGKRGKGNGDGSGNGNGGD